MNKTSYWLLRIGIAVSMLGHGLVRMPKLAGFSAWMTKSFEHSLLPAALVKPFSYILPFAELFTGIFLLVGLFTKQALIAGSVVMIVLVFGTTMIENWDALPSQLIHLAFFAFLLHYIGSNSFAIDKMITAQAAH